MGGTLQHIRKGDVTGLEVPVPPLDEQDNIVQQIEDIDINRVHRSVGDISNLIDEYRNSVLSHAFIQTQKSDKKEEGLATTEM